MRGAGEIKETLMKTLDQILEGVTAGGRWESEQRWLDANRQQLVYFANKQGVEDAAYVARAARNFPALVRALENVLKDARCSSLDHSITTLTEAETALAEALKD